MRKIFLALTITGMIANATVVKNIDNEGVNISLVNNRANLLSFPFILDSADLATDDAENYAIKVKKNTAIIIPSVDKEKERSSNADLIILTKDNYSYLIRMSLGGKDQRFNFTTSRVLKDKPHTEKIETGKIDSDVKRIIKLMETKKNIPGYKKTKVKKQLDTPNLLLQKNTMYDGSKYRAEEWFIFNKTNSEIYLDYADFYTKGVMAISFDNPVINPKGVISMFLIINKASIAEE